jgi:predicted DNA binding CopG/RHH family protein
MTKRARKPVPEFATEDEERKYWARHDSTDHVDWSQGEKRSFAKLRPSLRTISLRLPESMIGQLQLLARKRDVPYQSLLKQFLAERLQLEQAKHPGPAQRR